jgi:hypothetical protein
MSGGNKKKKNATAKDNLSRQEKANLERKKKGRKEYDVSAFFRTRTSSFLYLYTVQPQTYINLLVFFKKKETLFYVF